MLLQIPKVDSFLRMGIIGSWSLLELGLGGILEVIKRPFGVH